MEMGRPRLIRDTAVVTGNGQDADGATADISVGQRCGLSGIADA